jgi:hypothetical protein
MILWVLLAVTLTALLCFALLWGDLPLLKDLWPDWPAPWSDDGGTAALRQEQTFPVDEISRVVVEGRHHDVHITFTDTSTITAREYAPERWPEARLLAVRREGGTLSITAPRRHFYLWWGLSGADGRLELELPARFRGGLSAETASGHIEWTGESTLTELKLATVSGDINLTGHAAANRASIETVSGHIQLAALTAADQYHLSSVSGSIDAAALTGRGSADAVSGSLWLTLTELTGGCSLESVSGSVSLSLPADSAFYYNVSSVSGDIRIDFPLVFDGGALRTLSGSVGEAPVHRVDIETVSGGVRLIRRAA